MTLTKIVNPQIKSRAGYKSRITLAINDLNKKLADNVLNKDLFSREESKVLKWLDRIEEINTQIADICDKEDIDVNDTARQADMQTEQLFCSQTQSQLLSISSHLVSHPLPPSNPPPITSQDALVSAIAKLQSNPVKPKLQCSQFSGKDVDKLEFKNFLIQFQNCVDAGGSLPGSAKLTYLRSYLTGYAYKIISHLSITDDNYDTAVALLKDEFLDTEFIADEYFRQIIKASPKYDVNFENVRQYLNETRAALHELKSYNIDLLEEDTSGNKLISHIIFDKLPNIIKRELVHKVDSNFPTINQLFDNYNDILKTLSRTSYKKDYDQRKPQISTQVKSQNSSSFKIQNDKGKRNSAVEKSKPISTLENFQTKAEKSVTFKSHCKFCNANNHSMFLCPKYSNHDTRIDRCKELSLCDLCSSSKHMSKDCFGKENKLSYECKICKSKGHISALCMQYEPKVNGNSSHTNICINSGIQTQDYILPIMRISAKRGRNKCQFNCLIDTGSQRSYLSHQVIEKLNINLTDYSSVNYDVSTFLGAKKKELKQMMLDIDYSPGNTVPLPVLVDEEFDLKFHVSDFATVISNVEKLGFKLAADFDRESNLIEVNGLIGVDLIQYMKPMEVIDCMYGSAWRIPQGVIPFGNAQNFLYRSQITPSEGFQESVNHYNTVISQFSSVPITHVNFVLNPKQSYFDPLSEVFSESQVERNIDKMFSCESLGISDDQEYTSDYDKTKIREFEESIEYKDNSYHIKLP